MWVCLYACVHLHILRTPIFWHFIPPFPPSYHFSHLSLSSSSLPFFPSPLFIFNPPYSPFSPQLIIGRFAVSLASMFVRNGTGSFWGSRKKVGFEVSFHHVSNTYHLLHQINMASESNLVYTVVGISTIPLTLTLMRLHLPHTHTLTHTVIPTLITLTPIHPHSYAHFLTHTLTPSHRHWGYQPPWNRVLPCPECSQLCRGSTSLP